MMSPYQRLGRWLSARRTPRGRWAFLLGGAVISASLLALYSRVEAPWFALGFVALVPWLFAQDRVTSLREAAGAGLAMSVAFVALVFILTLVTFIGEAVREAFDPRRFTVYK